jgi:hypothetical protein
MVRLTLLAKDPIERERLLRDSFRLRNSHFVYGFFFLCDTLGGPLCKAQAHPVISNTRITDFAI